MTEYQLDEETNKKCLARWDMLTDSERSDVDAALADPNIMLRLLYCHTQCSFESFQHLMLSLSARERIINKGLSTRP